MDTLHTINHLVQRLSYDLRCLHPRHGLTATEKEKYAALEMLSTTNHAIKVLLDKLRLELLSSTESSTSGGNPPCVELPKQGHSSHLRFLLHPTPLSEKLWLELRESPCMYSTTTQQLRKNYGHSTTSTQELDLAGLQLR